MAGQQPPERWRPTMAWPPSNPHYTGRAPAPHQDNTTEQPEDDGEPLEEEEPQE